MMVWVFLLSLMGFYLLLLLNKKQQRQTSTFSRVVLRYPRTVRSLAILCFVLGCALCMSQYGASIGFVSWWIFASPVIFVLILCKNSLKKPQS